MRICTNIPTHACKLTPRHACCTLTSTCVQILPHIYACTVCIGKPSYTPHRRTHTCVSTGTHIHTHLPSDTHARWSHADVHVCHLQDCTEAQPPHTEMCAFLPMNPNIQKLAHVCTPICHTYTHIYTHDSEPFWT